MKNLYTDALDAIHPDEQKKHETVNMLIEYNKAQASGAKKVKQKNKRRFVWNFRRVAVAAATAAILIFCAIFIPIVTNGKPNPGWTIKATNLMQEITAAQVNEKAADKAFTDAAADFSLELFKKSFSNEKNSLISPTSVLLALAMTANGADGQTLSQMEKTLGKDLSLQELNEYLYTYVKNLPSEEKSRLEIANSIWFKQEGFNVNRDFLQTNADYYDAAAYSAPFDKETVKDINNWVKDATEGLIDEIIKEIPDAAIMYLINCVLFDAEWSVKYEESDVRDWQFTAYNNEMQTTKFMHSEESRYLRDGGATGFIKPYFGNKYSFAAILPAENDTIDNYVASLTCERFVNTIKNALSIPLYTAMPKFEYEFELDMNDALKAMGMSEAFDKYNADFNKIGTTSMPGKIFISKVKHKTFISVDEAGTKAGAVTSIEMKGSTSVEPQKIYVTLDRPFLYAIIDNATSLPVFIGTLITAK